MAKVPDDGRVTEKLKLHNIIIIIITVIVTLQHSCATTEVQFRIKKGGRGERKGERGEGGGRQSRTIYLKNRDWNCAAVILMII